MNTANGSHLNTGEGDETEPLNPTARIRAWFCVRTRPKSEHIAAAHLRDLDQVEVFNPRIRFRRPRGRHQMWVTEALFPGYVFARFNWHERLKAVYYTNGVTGIVHFGEQWPIIDDSIIREWQSALGQEELALCEDLPQPGEDVLITTGAFKGLLAQVVRVSNAQKRIAVLMEFLGQQVQLDLNSDQFTRLDVREKVSVPPPNAS